MGKYMFLARFSQMERGDRELSIREKIVENDSVDLEIRISEDCVFP